MLADWWVVWKVAHLVDLSAGRKADPSVGCLAVLLADLSVDDWADQTVDWWAVLLVDRWVASRAAPLAGLSAVPKAG